MKKLILFFLFVLQTLLLPAQNIVGKWSLNGISNPNMTMGAYLFFNSNGGVECRLTARVEAEVYYFESYSSVPGTYVINGNNITVTFNKNYYYYKPAKESVFKMEAQGMSQAEFKQRKAQFDAEMAPQFNSMVSPGLKQAMSMITDNGALSGKWSISGNTLVIDNASLTNINHTDNQARNQKLNTLAKGKTATKSGSTSKGKSTSSKKSSSTSKNRRH